MPTNFIETQEIRQGNIGPLWKVGVLDENGDNIVLNVNYTCRLVVSLGNTSILDRSITDKDITSNYFLVQLTPVETEAFALTRHNVWIEIENTLTSPPFRFETKGSIKVIKQGISAA